MPSCYTCDRTEIALFVSGEAFHPVKLENRETHDTVKAIVCTRCLGKMERHKK
jgi:hypothetical protein